ncbi:hypothetical protein ACMU_04840 [Actibacterium mucosum KCTC 23349]|uniref:HTH gntR-type domain-containing protein n=1 Tax=Actibacterium mucosum KCTC 23349 TaxID=1454373 RepID=A0A037ZBW2_9RHOB|nr:GntR family transcriptional regulator [Actibacterium mucosum]KAJ53959.1 hypothetical protein ACMU_04840 [Actibacterium mucosum KCTC 23349]
MVQRAKSLTTQVFEELLDDIVLGRRASGTMLSEKAVSQEFGTSKTPVREAFVQLQGLGLVDVLPQRGCLVFSPTVEQVRHLSEMRVILECAAMELAMERAGPATIKALRKHYDRMESRMEAGKHTEFGREDNAFHRVFFEHAGNPALIEAHGLFAPRLQALRTNLQSSDGYLLSKAQADHLAIIEGLENADMDAATTALKKHVSRMIDKYETEGVLLSSATG